MAVVYTSSPATTLRVGDNILFTIKGQDFFAKVSGPKFGPGYFIETERLSDVELLNAAFGLVGAELFARVAEIYGHHVYGNELHSWPLANDLHALTRLVRAVFARCDQRHQDARPIEVGQMIAGLRGVDTVDEILRIVGGRELYVATEMCPEGVKQVLRGDEKVKWPWEDDSQWRNVTSEEWPTPIFKLGQVWKTLGGYLVRIVQVHEKGWGNFYVMHAPKGCPRPAYQGMWGVHPNGSYCNWNQDCDPRTDLGRKDDRFALVTKVSD